MYIYIYMYYKDSVVIYMYYIYIIYIMYIFSLSNQAVCIWAHEYNMYKVQIVINNLPQCSISFKK